MKQQMSDHDSYFWIEDQNQWLWQIKAISDKIARWKKIAQYSRLCLNT